MIAGAPATAIKNSSSPPSFLFFEGLFLVSLILYPLLFGSTYLWGFSMATAFMCAAFLPYWFLVAQRKPFLHSKLDVWVAVYAVFFLVSLGFSKIPYLSWVELFKLDVVLCAFICTRYLCRERPQIYRMTEMFVFLGALLSGIGLLQFVGGLPNDWWSHPQFLSSMYVNHNHFAGLLVLLLPITFGMVLAERQRAKKVLFLFITGLMGVAFVFALSRGALVSLGLALVVMMVLLKKRDLISSSVLPFIIFIALVVIAVVVFGTDSIEQRVENIRSMTQEEELSLQFRWLTWLGTLPMIASHFWFGSGPGTFGHVFLHFRPSGFSMRPVHAHNDVLQLLAEGGLFTFAAVAILFLVFFIQGWRIVSHDESRLRIGVGSGILAGMFGLLVHSLFDFNFHIPANWLLSSVAAGLLFSMDHKESYRPRTSIFLKGLLSIMLASALAGTFYLGLSQYNSWEANELLKVRDRKSALESIERSLRLNPYDAEAHYLRGFIRSLGRDTKSSEDFDRAIALNGYEPVYDLAKARSLAPALASSSPETLIQLFQNALSKDPHNAKLAFSAARDILRLDPKGDGRLRMAAEDMLHSAVRFDPSFAESSLDELWRHTPNVSQILKFYGSEPRALEGLVIFLERKDLWKHHRRFNLKMLRVDPDAFARKFTLDAPIIHSFALDDFSHIGLVTPTDRGMFFQNGEVHKKITNHNRLVMIELELKGSASKGVYPALYVKIDGKLIDECYVDNTDYKKFNIVTLLKPGTHMLSLEYVNDFQDRNRPAEDRNLWIRRVLVRETVES